MPTMLEVMQSRLGIQEVAGAGNNPVIVKWCADIGWPSITDDATAWCSTCMCSAALEASMPMPAHNNRPAARSWLTWGVAVEPKNIKPGDVAIWPRGTSTWQGHVNIVEAVLPDGRVICIGGNQKGPSGDAVTRTKPLDPAGALGFRRPVEPTVKALREAGSTTIKSNDNLEKIGIVATFFTPIFEGVKSLFEGAPSLNSVAGLTYWEAIGKAASNVLGYAHAHPYMVAIIIVGVGMWGNSYLAKRARVAEHAAGIPLSAEVAKAGAA